MDIIKYMKMIRRGDVIIVLLLMIGSFLPLGIFTYNNAQAGQTNLQALVVVDGETLRVFDLVDDGQIESFHYRDEHGHENVIVRTGTSVEMAEANCNDQICVRMNAISQPGGTILCLPHRLLVEVISDQPVENHDGIDVIS